MEKESEPPIVEIIEKSPCLWNHAHNQGSPYPLCEDGAFTWDCVGGNHGQRLQCPVNYPLMCSTQTCGSSKQNYCCETDCSSKGGLRPSNCSPGCAPQIPLDLVFLLDSSGSVGQIGFHQSQVYLKKVAAELPLGNSNTSTHISIIQFSSEAVPTVEVPIFEGDALSKVTAAVDDMTWHKEDTHTGEAIEYVLDNVFPLSRAGTADMLVIITDGKANGNTTPAEAAVRAKQMGVDIMAVGIAEFDYDELLEVTQGDTKKVLTVERHSDLVSAVNKTVKMICESAGAFPTPVPSPMPTAPTPVPPTPPPTPQPTPQPTFKPCPALSSTESSTTVNFEGYQYRTLTGFRWDLTASHCENQQFTPVQPGYWLVPYSSHIWRNVVANRPWSTQGMVFEGGEGNNPQAWGTQNGCAGSCGETNNAYVPQTPGNGPGGFKTGDCPWAILIRKPC